MDNLIEVEIENKSYIELLNLDQQKKNTLRLTTLEDNQSAVIIKIFLKKLENRFPIKEFHVQDLRLKASGLPRFELMCSYAKKKIYLELRVDGEKADYDEVKLNTYLRNKFLPLFVIMGIIAVLFLVFGGKWLIGNVISKEKNTNTQLVRTKSELSNDDSKLPSKTTVPEEKIESPSPIEKVEEYTDTRVEMDNNSAPLTEVDAVETTIEKDENPAFSTKIKVTAETDKTSEVINSRYTAYFTPNNTEIQKEAKLELKNLAKNLKTIPKALVKISGHCAMTGTGEGRERLSKDRAFNTLNYLKKEGWVPETEPLIKWYGGTQPVTKNPDEIYKNRRVEIEIVLP